MVAAFVMLALFPGTVSAQDNIEKKKIKFFNILSGEFKKLKT
jgi:hypothetical protein